MRRFFKFGQLATDSQDYDNPLLDKADGAFPIHGSYRSIRKAAVTSSSDDLSGSYPKDSLGITGGIAHYFTGTKELKVSEPDDDISTEKWSRIGKTEDDDYYPQVAGHVPDDSRYLRFTTVGTDSATLEVRYESVDDPTSGSDHTVKYRYRFAEGEADQWDAVFSLYEDGTKIADLTSHSEMIGDDEWQSVQHTLEAVEADAITDYRDLRLRVDATLTGAGADSAAPDEDLENDDSWLRDDGDDEDLFESIDGPGFDDQTYVESATTGGGGTSAYRFGFAEMDDPETDPGISARVRASISDGEGELVFRILEDGVEVGNTTFELTTDPTTFEFQLPDGSVITDFEQVEGEVVFHPAVEAGTEPAAAVPKSFTAKVAVAGSIADINTEDGTTAEIGPGGGRLRAKLESIPDPGTNSDHQIRFVGNGDVAADSISVQLFQGGTAVFDSRTVDGNGGKAISTTPGSEETWSIPAANVKDITSYGALHLQVISHNSAATEVHVDYMALEIPALKTCRVYSSWIEASSRSAVDVAWTQLVVPEIGTPEDPDAVQLYAGDQEAIYEVSDESFADVSQAGGYGATLPRSWSFTSFGENVIATNKLDPVQVRDADDALFRDLFTSTDKPQAAHVVTAKNHLVLANIEYAGSPAGQPDEVWWSALGDPEDMDVSLATQAGRDRVIDVAGEITALSGGEFVLVFKRSSITRLGYIGAPLVWRKDTISTSVGTIHPRSVVQHGRDVYFYSRQGFHVVRDGSYVQPVGSGVVNRMMTDVEFEDNAVDLESVGIEPLTSSKVIGDYDKVTGLIWWLIGRKVDADWQNRLVLFYNPIEDRWGTLELADGPSGIAGEASGLTHLWGLPSPVETSESISRGVAGVTADYRLTGPVGKAPSAYVTNHRLVRFNENTSFRSLFETKIWSSKFLAGQEITNLLINFIRPSYRMSPEALARPDVDVLIESSNDPLLQFEVGASGASLADANEDLWYPVDSEGEFFRFTVTIPETVGESVREVNGIGLTMKTSGEF